VVIVPGLAAQSPTAADSATAARVEVVVGIVKLQGRHSKSAMVDGGRGGEF